MENNNVLNARELHNRGIESKDCKYCTFNSKNGCPIEQCLCPRCKNKSEFILAAEYRLSNRFSFNSSDVVVSVPLGFLLSVHAYLSECYLHDDDNHSFLRSLFIESHNIIHRFQELD